MQRSRRGSTSGGSTSTSTSGGSTSTSGGGDEADLVTTVVFAFTKIGTYAVAPPEEIYFLASHNLLGNWSTRAEEVTWEVSTQPIRCAPLRWKARPAVRRRGERERGWGGVGCACEREEWCRSDLSVAYFRCNCHFADMIYLLFFTPPAHHPLRNRLPPPTHPTPPSCHVVGVSTISDVA
jgi:hypothetical protein